MENAWSYQLKNGRIGTKKHIILHTLKTGRDGPVMSLTRKLQSFPSGPRIQLSQLAGCSLGGLLW